MANPPVAIMESLATTHSWLPAGKSALVTVTKNSVSEKGTVIICVLSPLDQANAYWHPIAGLITFAVITSESLVALHMVSISTVKVGYTTTYVVSYNIVSAAIHSLSAGIPPTM